MSKYFILLIALLSNSCKDHNENAVSFTIINNSNQTIDNVNFLAGAAAMNQWFFSDSIMFTQIIEPDSSETFIWKNPKLDRLDGSFYLKVGDLERGVGYYSNGIILEEYSNYILAIYNDSIK